MLKYIKFMVRGSLRILLSFKYFIILFAIIFINLIMISNLNHNATLEKEEYITFLKSSSINNMASYLEFDDESFLKLSNYYDDVIKAIYDNDMQSYYSLELSRSLDIIYSLNKIAGDNNVLVNDNKNQVIDIMNNFNTYKEYGFRSNQINSYNMFVVVSENYFYLLNNEDSYINQYNVNSTTYITFFIINIISLITIPIILLLSYRIIEEEKANGTLKQYMSIGIRRVNYFRCKAMISVIVFILLIVSSLLIVQIYFLMFDGTFDLNYPMPIYRETILSTNTLVENYNLSLGTSHTLVEHTFRINQFDLPIISTGFSEIYVPHGIEVVPVSYILLLYVVMSSMLIYLVSKIAIYFELRFKNNFVGVLAVVVFFVIQWVIGNIFPKLSIFESINFYNLITGKSETTYLLIILNLCFYISSFSFLISKYTKKKDIF